MRAPCCACICRVTHLAHHQQHTLQHVTDDIRRHAQTPHLYRQTKNVACGNLLMFCSRTECSWLAGVHHDQAHAHKVTMQHC